MQFDTDNRPLDFDPANCIVAGWTGRDAAAVEHHIAELAALGIAPPSRCPLFYQVASSLLTLDPTIEVVGEQTSGEAEPLLIQSNGHTYLGLASDHTDRATEVYSVAVSKQVCAKPVAQTLWRLDPDLVARLDSLELHAWIFEADEWVAYQSGTLASILPLAQLMEAAPLTEGDAMLCGTLAAIGGVRPTPRFRAELLDPTTNRRIQLEYTTRTLAAIS